MYKQGLCMISYVSTKQAFTSTSTGKVIGGRSYYTNKFLEGGETISVGNNHGIIRGKCDGSLSNLLIWYLQSLLLVPTIIHCFPFKLLDMIWFTWRCENTPFSIRHYSCPSNLLAKSHPSLDCYFDPVFHFSTSWHDVVDMMMWQLSIILSKIHMSQKT